MAGFFTDRRTYLYVEDLNIFQVDKVCKYLKAHSIDFTVKLEYQLEDRNIYTVEADVTGCEYTTTLHLESLDILES